MALRISVQVPVMSPFPSSTKWGNPASSSVRFNPPRTLRPLKTKQSPGPVTAVDESQANSETNASEESKEESGQPELGAEIKKAMEERKKNEGDLSFSGVAEEVREIEWPVFGKVLGTTGVVLGVIAGSSVVLLTVNAILAELSDRAFAGRGVQDFFG